jgi:UDP-glucuronate 4-epimerase
MRRLCEAVVHGSSFELHGDGSVSRDFTYVADAVDATIRAMALEELPDTLNIGGGEEASLSSVIMMIEEIAQYRIDVRQGRPQRGDVRRTAADTARARTHLGWVPTRDLRAGLAAQLAWVADRAGVRLPGRVGALR